MKIEPPAKATHYYVSYCSIRGVLEMTFYREYDRAWWKISPSGEEKMMIEGLENHLIEIGVKH